MNSEFSIDPKRLEREITYYASRYFSKVIPDHEVNRAIILSTHGELSSSVFEEGRRLLRDLGVTEIEENSLGIYTKPGAHQFAGEDDRTDLPF